MFPENEFSEGMFLRSPSELGCWKLLHYANESVGLKFMSSENEFR